VVDRSNQLSIMRTRPSTDSRRSMSYRGSPAPRAPLAVSLNDGISPDTTPYLSAHASTSSLGLDDDSSRKVTVNGSRLGLGSQSSSRFAFASDPNPNTDPDSDFGPDDSFKSEDRASGGQDLTPLVIQTERMPSNNGSTVVLRHSDEFTDDGLQELSFRAETPVSFGRSQSPRAGTGTGMGMGMGMGTRTSPRSGSGVGGGGSKGKGTADKAGVILGIHNVFLVLPQFIVTFLSSIIFYLMEPDKGVPAKHPQIPVAEPAIGNGNGTLPGLGIERAEEAVVDGMKMLFRREGPEGGSSDAVGLIFR
jgi:hypothetical protein